MCSYQVLATYESDLLEQFSLCILQKHNCLRNFKSVPMTPAPVAMTSYRAMPMTHELAEDLFIGNLAPEHGAASSWRVVYGKNAGATISQILPGAVEILFAIGMTSRALQGACSQPIGLVHMAAETSEVESAPSSIQRACT